MKYILVEWPDVQYLMDKEGFKENSSLADGEKFGSSAYFVSEEWYDENYEEEEYSFIVETTVEVPIEIDISITGTNYLLVKLDMNWADEFDVNAFWVTTQNRYDQFLRTITEYDFSNDEFYFGTNEWISFDSTNEVIRSLQVIPITKEFYDQLITHFGEEYGLLPITRIEEHAAYMLEELKIEQEKDIINYET